MDTIFRSNFRFIATRYEEWQAGRCINEGRIEAEITAEVKNDEIIRFKIDDADDLRILKDFEFELLHPHSEALPNRVQYTHATNDFNPIVPMVCHIFHNNNKIEYVRFAMTNPDRLIEFYGYTAEISQPQRMSPKAKKDYSRTTAQTIIDELKSYGMYNTTAVFERACNLFSSIANLEVEEQIRLTIESHKLFVETYHLAFKEAAEEEYKHEPIILPRVLINLAYCNCMVGNNSESYHIAKLAEKTLDSVMETSPILGIRDQIGGKEIDEFLKALVASHGDEIDETARDIDPCKLEVRNMGKPEESEIKAIIKAIEKIGKDLSDFAASRHNNDLVFEAWRIKQMMELYTYPLLYAWEFNNYGWHTDFWEEGHSMFEYMMFEINVKETTEKLLESLKGSQSPFSNFERNGAITQGLIKIYNYVLRNL